jgi:hypothetical protein
VAGEEYDKEVAMRRELEAEVTRLKAQVHTQTARLSVISGDERRQETMKRRSQDLASSLSGLERDISRLRAQRDMSVAEVEELEARRKLVTICADAQSDADLAVRPRIPQLRSLSSVNRSPHDSILSRSSTGKSSSHSPLNEKRFSARLPNFARRESKY